MVHERHTGWRFVRPSMSRAKRSSSTPPFRSPQALQLKSNAQPRPNASPPPLDADRARSKRPSRMTMQLLDLTTARGPNDLKAFSDLADCLGRMDGATDVEAFLKRVDVKQVIAEMPHSLPLLDAIYAKCPRADLFAAHLHPDELLRQLVWWIAHCESRNQPAKKMLTRMDCALSLHLMAPHVRSLLAAICEHRPQALASIREQCVRLEKALEGLGLHGLVNCRGDKLIHISDAVRLELTACQVRIKHTLQQLNKAHSADHKSKSDAKLLFSVSGSVGSEAPSCASHQRLMTLKVSEIHDRLQRNEGLLEKLQSCLRNDDLDCLRRILQKRVTSDQDILTFYGNLSQRDNGFSSLGGDPAVASLLVFFQKAYEKVLGLLPADYAQRAETSDDSGLGLDESASCSSPETIDGDAPPPPHARHFRRLGPVEQQLKGKYRPDARKTHHKSLGNLHAAADAADPDLLAAPGVRLRSALSLEQLAPPNGLPLADRADCDADLAARTPPMQRRTPPSPPPRRDERADGPRLRAEVGRLSDELRAANRRIAQLTPDAQTCPQPDYPGSSSPPPPSAAIQRYSLLFAKDRCEIVRQLNHLPDFDGSEELQMKVILSVVVLAFRSVRDALNEKRAAVHKALQIEKNTADTCAHELDDALYRFLLRQAKSESGMRTAKEVTSHIWRTLYDFPSLKTCTRFNRFILDCVDVAWTLSAGADGEEPRFELEFEGERFDPKFHLRFHNSSLRSDCIKRYVWPGLLDSNTKQSAFKAIVVT